MCIEVCIDVQSCCVDHSVEIGWSDRTTSVLQAQATQEIL